MGFAFGTTLTSGIQDISALLPLLGTEQCEELVGASLIGGFLYAAAAPLSIFGSLGIVLAGSKALAASVVIRTGRTIVMGAKKVKDVRLELKGEVLSQIRWDPDGECHVAETQLTQILKELHIKDVERLTVDAVTLGWNFRMFVTSFIAIVFSITPYIYLIKNNHSGQVFLRWFFPLSRSIGSLIISDMVQVLIQTRLLQIINYRIVFLTLNDYIGDKYTKLPTGWNSLQWDARFSSEVALSNLETWLKKSSDEESPEPAYKSLKSILEETIRHRLPLSISTTLLVAQITVACGLVLTLVGYIGCFSLVQSSSNSLGPLIWLITEVVLSLMRMLIWGWNPDWDEKTYLSFNLALARHSPMSTCSKFSEELDKRNMIPLTSSREFLRDIKSFVGFLKPLKVTEDGSELYYTMTRRESDGERVLYATVVDKVNCTRTLIYPSNTPERQFRGGVLSREGGKHALCATIKNVLSKENKLVAELKMHCHTILQKLRTHTVMEALPKVLAEVLADGLADEALAEVLQNWNIEQVASEGCLGRRISTVTLDLMGVLEEVLVHKRSLRQVQVQDALSQARELKKDLSQGHFPDEKEPSQVYTLREKLRLALALDPVPGPGLGLAEVIMLALVLAQRQDQSQEPGLGQQLAEVVAEVLAHWQAPVVQDALNHALELALTLRNALRVPTSKLMLMGQDEDAADGERPGPQAIDVHRPQLHTDLTWVLKVMEKTEHRAKKAEQTRKAAGPKEQTPKTLQSKLTDDDQDDMQYLQVRRLESRKRGFFTERSKWVKGCISLLMKESFEELLQGAQSWEQGPRREQGPDMQSQTTTVETYILYELRQMEQMLVEESRRLEAILKSRSMEIVAALKDRRGGSAEDSPLEMKILAEQKANARSRVAKEAEDVQLQMKKLKEEARQLKKWHSGQTAGSNSEPLPQTWNSLMDDVSKAWEGLIKGADQDIEASVIKSLSIKSHKSLQVQDTAKADARLADEWQMMEQRLLRAGNPEYHEFLHQCETFKYEEFLVWVSLSKHSKFVQLPAKTAAKNIGIAAVANALRRNTVVSCVDCTECSDIDDVITLIKTGPWKAKSVTLIMPVFLAFPKSTDKILLETALRSNKSVLSLSCLDDRFSLPDTWSQVIEQHRKDACILGANDRPFKLVFYQCVEISEKNYPGKPYLLFSCRHRPSCIVWFSVPNKSALTNRVGAGTLTLRLEHCRTSAYGRFSIIHIMMNRAKVSWEQEDWPRDGFGVQNIELPLPGDSLDQVNKLSITVMASEYWLRDVQLVWSEGGVVLEVW